MFKEFKEVREINELKESINKINEARALIFIKSTIEYEKGYNGLNNNKKEYFSACINYCLDNIRDAIKYKVQINENFKNVKIVKSNTTYLHFKDFIKWYNRILNSLVFTEELNEFEKVVNEFENTELDIKTL